MIYLIKTNDMSSRPDTLLMSSRLSEAHGEISPLTPFGRDDKKHSTISRVVHKRNFVTCDFVTLRYYQIIRARKNTELYVL